MFLITNNAARVRYEKIVAITILPITYQCGLTGPKTHTQKADIR